MDDDELEEMNVYQLQRTYMSDETNDLFITAWRKEFPNLPFVGSMNMEQSFEHILGCFTSFKITYPCCIEKYRNPDFKCEKPIIISFDEKKIISVGLLLRILNRIDLPDFGNHTKFIGFHVVGNEIHISCDS